MKEEIWKEIEGFGGRYLISNQGRVKSFAQEPMFGKIIRPKKSLSGYNIYMLSLEHVDKRVAKRASRLVAEAFIPNPHGYDTVDHIRKDEKTNDTVENLQWMPQAENIRKDQAVMIECVHPVKGKFLVKGTRQAAQIASCTRGVVQYALRKGVSTRTEWRFRIIK